MQIESFTKIINPKWGMNLAKQIKSSNPPPQLNDQYFFKNILNISLQWSQKVFKHLKHTYTFFSPQKLII